MTVKLGVVSKSIARVAAVIVVAAGASACSSVPDWVDPTTWIGGDDNAPAATPDQQAAENQPTPDVASVPDKPAPASTTDEQKQVAESLNADKAQTQYSGDALRGGTEASAPPPSDAPPPDQVTDLTAGTTPPAASSSTASSATPSSDTASSSDKVASSNDQSSSPPPAAPDQKTASSATPAVPADSSSSSAGAAPSAAPNTKVAMAEQPSGPAPGAMPAVPAVPGGGSMMPGMAAQDTSDAALGFQRSNAPALDPSVSQFVAQPIMARYQETASVSGTAGIHGGAAVPGTQMAGDSGPAVPAVGTPPRHSKYGMGGPEKMSGAVVANFNSLQTAAVAPAQYSGATGGSPSAIVFFPKDTTILNADARAQIRGAVQSYMASGGQGYIRVVGHSSSGSASLSDQRRMIWNFERSQARAKAVAQELIRAGVPASRVLVEAVGDAPAAYYGAAQPGQDSGRSAEIYFQS